MPSLLPKDTYVKNAHLYHLFSNPTRLEILNRLADDGEHSVETLRKELKISKSNLSQHLRLLRHAHLVTVRKNGTCRCYRIVDPQIVAPCKLLHALRRKGKIT